MGRLTAGGINFSDLIRCFAIDGAQAPALFLITHDDKDPVLSVAARGSPDGGVENLCDQFVGNRVTLQPAQCWQSAKTARQSWPRCPRCQLASALSPAQWNGWSTPICWLPPRSSFSAARQPTGSGRGARPRWASRYFAVASLIIAVVPNGVV